MPEGEVYRIALVLLVTLLLPRLSFLCVELGAPPPMVAVATIADRVALEMRVPMPAGPRRLCRCLWRSLSPLAP